MKKITDEQANKIAKILLSSFIINQSSELVNYDTAGADNMNKVSRQLKAMALDMLPDGCEIVYDNADAYTQILKDAQKIKL